MYCSDIFAKYGWGARIYTCKNWATAFLSKQEQVYRVPQGLNDYVPIILVEKKYHLGMRDAYSYQESG